MHTHFETESGSSERRLLACDAGVWRVVCDAGLGGVGEEQRQVACSVPGTFAVSCVSGSQWQSVAVEAVGRALETRHRLCWPMADVRPDSPS